MLVILESASLPVKQASQMKLSVIREGERERERDTERDTEIER